VVRAGATPRKTRSVGRSFGHTVAEEQTRQGESDIRRLGSWRSAVHAALLSGSRASVQSSGSGCLPNESTADQACGCRRQENTTALLGRSLANRPSSFGVVRGSVERVATNDHAHGSPPGALTTRSTNWLKQARPAESALADRSAASSDFETSSRSIDSKRSVSTGGPASPRRARRTRAPEKRAHAG